MSASAAPNADENSDAALFGKLGMTALESEEPMRARVVEILE